MASLIHQMPGFRSGRKWRQWVAIIGYACIALSIIGGITGGNPGFTALGLEALLLVLMASNAWGLRSRIPILSSSNRLVAFGGWVGALLIMFVLLVAVSPLASQPATDTLASGSSGATSPVTGGQETSVPAAAAPKATQVPATATAVPATRTPVPTSTPVPTATPRPSPTPVVGKRDAPVPFGSAYTLKDGRSTFQVQVTSVERNGWPMVKKANQFNEAPPAGNDYIVVKLRLKYLVGPQDEPYKTTDGDYKLYADNRFWGAPGFGNVPAEPRFTSQNIFPGATVEGWIAGRYLPVELMDQAALVYGDAYFALK